MFMLLLPNTICIYSQSQIFYLSLSTCPIRRGWQCERVEHPLEICVHKSARRDPNVPLQITTGRLSSDKPHTALLFHAF